MGEGTSLLSVNESLCLGSGGGSSTRGASLGLPPSPQQNFWVGFADSLCSKESSGPRWARAWRAPRFTELLTAAGGVTWALQPGVTEPRGVQQHRRGGSAGRGRAGPNKHIGFSRGLVHSNH